MEKNSAAIKTNTYLYTYKDSIYINLTNRCTAQCVYCIKYSWQWRFRGCSLKISKEPSAEEVIKAFAAYKHSAITQAVFCGYGEPLLRLNEVLQIAAYLKNHGFTVRINTNGHGNLIHKKNIVPVLKGLIDAVSVSLNASNAEQYLKLHKPVFGIQTFDAILEFITECKKYIPRVIVTTVALPEISLEACRAIAEKLGAEFRVRPYLADYEDS